MSENKKNYTDAQYSKLPIWAKNELARLEANSNYYENKLKEIGNPEATNTYFPLNSTTNQYLPKNQRVVFNIDGGELGIQIKGDRLEIHSQSFNKELCVTPRFANGVSIRFV